MKNLVIVESPAKAKTIEKFLGKDYKVLSSYGHIRDLSKKEIRPDAETGFTPDYEIPADKKELVRTLRKAAKEADMVWLASDEDREGEAIAWHLYEVLGLDPARTRRIVFHEITKPAILNAIANPRGIDIDRVNAQQARRVLDRIVGFELSPVLWRKIKPALSAGRVQSVAVRLICEREKEISAFASEAYYRLTARFLTVPGGAELKAEAARRVPDEQSALALLEECRKAADEAAFRVTDVKVHPLRRSPAPPFTTSTLQQEASRRLGFSVNQTMLLAQKLYEDGHITYMRTDSLNLSDLAMADISREISREYGDDYLKPRRYHTSSKGAQEAHEAIRPTYIDKVSVGADEQQRRLYTLIRQRTLACQMADAQLEKTNIDIAAGGIDETFRAEGEVVKFAGFMQAYSDMSRGLADLAEAERPLQQGMLPAIATGDEVTLSQLTATQRFSQPPARYTEATLVKKMEDLGIGRPSTYAPTISTIQQREYIKRGDRDGAPRDYIRLQLEGDEITRTVATENTGSDKGRLVPTDVGMIVNDFLTEHFPDILDYNFTARVEEKFDDIAEGKLGWKNEITDFYSDFHPGIEAINDLRLDHKVGERILGTDPKSGRPVSVKIGRYGPVVQIGEASDEEKPIFASLKKGQSISSITFEEALELFNLPRTLGDFEDKTVVAGVGKFGPYVRHDGSFYTIPKGQAPETITLEEGIELIRQKRAKDAAAFIKAFPEMPGLEIVNGRYGPYMAYKPEGAKKKVNYKLPKGTDAAALTFEEAIRIKEAQDSGETKKSKKSATAKTSKTAKSKSASGKK